MVGHRPPSSRNRAGGAPIAAYAYRAVDASGLKVAGTIVADSAHEAERRLVAQDVILLSLAPASASAGKAAEAPKEGGGGLFRRKISAQDAADVLRNLAVMAETGVPFVEALESVRASSRTPAIEAALGRVCDAVVGGQTLSAALRGASEMFPTLVTDMVRIAETGGRLDMALGNGATYLERVADMRKKIVNAMMYPCVMLSVSVGTVGILIIFVMPKFAGMFASMKADLPVTTRLMLASGDFVRSSPLLALASVVGTIGGAALTLRTSAGRAALGALAARMPVVGDLLRRLALSRALGSISTLCESGVPLLHAIEHGARVAGPGAIGKALLRARDDIERGRTMSDALRDTGAFPKTLLQMVAVGERTGRLPGLLTRLSQQMESDVDARLKAVVAMVEPLMIVLMGTIVGGITVSIIGPIYSVVENVK